MGKRAWNGSPILPTYCLFLLSGEKSMAFLQTGGYFGKECTDRNMKKTKEKATLKANPARS